MAQSKRCIAHRIRCHSYRCQIVKEQSRRIHPSCDGNPAAPARMDWSRTDTPLQKHPPQGTLSRNARGCFKPPQLAIPILHPTSQTPETTHSCHHEQCSHRL